VLTPVLELCKCVHHADTAMPWIFLQCMHARANKVSHLYSSVLPPAQILTVDKAQGSESDVVVLSTVKCGQFTRDSRRMCVALSRARKLCILVSRSSRRT